jgi:predicted transcriptional regulator
MASEESVGGMDTFDQLKHWLSTKGMQVDNILDIISDEQEMNPHHFATRCNINWLLIHS